MDIKKTIKVRFGNDVTLEAYEKIRKALELTENDNILSMYYCKATKYYTVTLFDSIAFWRLCFPLEALEKMEWCDFLEKYMELI